MLVPESFVMGERRLVIDDCTVIDGNDNPPFENATVIIDGDKIDSIIRSDSFRSTQRDLLINAQGMTVIPGLWDAHVHVRSTGRPAQRALTVMEATVPRIGFWALSNSWRNLEYGVTSVRDMSSIGYVDVALRDAINEGVVPGPRLFVAGHGLTMYGGHMDPKRRPEIEITNHTGLANSPDEVKAAARYQIAQGVDLLKFNTSHSHLDRDGSVVLRQEMDYEMLVAGLREGEKVGISSATHCHGGQGALDAIRAGVRSIEHGHWLNDEHFELMLERDTYFCPTLSCNENRLRLGQEKADMDDAHWEWLKVACEDKHHTIERALKAGIKIVAGSDAGMPHTFHGIGATQEISYLVEYGMSPMEAIIAATRRPAEMMGVDDVVGTVEEGKIADLVILASNPLQDISKLGQEDNVRVVIREGEPLVDRLGVFSSQI